MKIVYIWIVLLVVIAAIISWYLIPSGEDLALIQLKSQKYSEAEKFYLEQYAKGVRTPTLVYELSVLYESEGNLEQAIQVIQDYAQTHPEDSEVLKRLADLYNLNGQFEAYDRTLVKLYEMHAKLDIDSLRELGDYYKNQNDSEQEEKIRKEIISSGKADDEDYSALANAYINQKKFDEAANLLKIRRSYFINKNTIDTILLELWVNVKLGKVKSHRAVHYVADFLKEKNNNQLTLYVLKQFQERYPTLALELIQQLDPLIKQNRQLEYEALFIQWEHPELKKKVLQRLRQLEPLASDDAALQNFIFNVYLDQADEKRLLGLIQKTPMQKIDESSLIELALFADQHENSALTHKMQEALGPEYLQKHPLIALALTISAHQPQSLEQFHLYQKSPALTPAERYTLFRLAVAAHLDQEILELGATLPPFTGRNASSMVEIAQAYASLKKADLLYPLIINSLPTLGTKNAEAALTLLDIALHHTQKAFIWIEKQDLIKRDILRAYFETAKENREYSLDLYLAKRLQKNYPSPLSDSSYALALVQVGKQENGLKILKQLYKEYPREIQIQNDYFSALIMAVKKDKRVSNDLLAFMSEKERQGHLSITQLRDFGYVYLDVLHHFIKASDIFFKLANRSSPVKNDVQTLIYLWGPHISKEKENWMIRQAELAKIEDLPEWLENLNFAGLYQATICIFQARMNPDLNLKANFAYMQALADKKYRKALKNIIDHTFPLIHERKQLEELALYAEVAEYTEARIWIWETIVAHFPNDPLAWQALAKAQFDARAYCLTDRSLTTFFYLNHSCNNKLYESLYEYAEVLRKERHFADSRHYYRLALIEIENSQEKTARMHEIAALSYYQLSWENLALSEMQLFFEITGRDPNAGAAYANMLMDEGRLFSSENFLRHTFLETKCNAP